MTLQLPGPFAKSAEIFASTKNDCDEYDGSDSAAAQSQQAEDRLPDHCVQKSFINALLLTYILALCMVTLVCKLVAYATFSASNKPSL